MTTTLSDLHAYTKNQISAARTSWIDKQMSDDYAYTNGSAATYEARIAHWESLEAFIAERLNLPKLSHSHTKPATPATLSHYLATWKREAETQISALLDFEDDYPTTLDTIHHYQHSWLTSQATTAKARANLYALLLGLPAPYPGINPLDPLNPTKPLPSARTANGGTSSPTS